VLGHPEAIGQAEQPLSANPAAHEVTPDQIAVMVERLAARLKDKPNDADGWRLLARSYAAIGRFSEAADAYAKASALTPNDPQLLADYADTLAVANGRNLAGKPLELVHTALKLDPNNQKSLALAGTAAFDNRDYLAAIAYWQRLRKTVPTDSDDARSMDANIAEARAAVGGQDTVTKSATVSNASRSPAHSAAIAGTVSLSPSVAAKAAPTDTVFIFARAVNGPKMPLAILRMQAKDLPKAFVLDDTMSMGPAMKLSNFQEVMVTARVSKAANATSQRGDLLGSIGPVRVGSRKLRVVIDQLVR
jgi:cytochrome c-type biogenesis protein CcmH